MWAFAREKGVPGHRYFSRVGHKQSLASFVQADWEQIVLQWTRCTRLQLGLARRTTARLGQGSTTILLTMVLSSLTLLETIWKQSVTFHQEVASIRVMSSSNEGDRHHLAAHLDELAGLELLAVLGDQVVERPDQVVVHQGDDRVVGDHRHRVLRGVDREGGHLPRVVGPPEEEEDGGRPEQRRDRHPARRVRRHAHQPDDPRRHRHEEEREHDDEERRQRPPEHDADRAERRRDTAPAGESGFPSSPLVCGRDCRSPDTVSHSHRR